MRINVEQAQKITNLLKQSAFVYNYVAFIIIASVFGSGYVLWTATVSSFLLALLLSFKEIKREYKQYKIFIFFIVNMVGCFVYNYFWGGWYLTSDVLFFQASVLFYSILHMMLAIIFFECLKLESFKSVMIVALLVLLLVVLFSYDFQRMSYPFSYQLVGAVLPVFALFSVTIIKDKYLKFMVFFVSMAIVYLLKTRASFYGLCAVFILFAAKELGFRFLIQAAIVILAILALNLKYKLFGFDQRMFGFARLTEDGSFSERAEQFKHGILAIKENWFFGQYGGQVIHFEGSKYPSVIGSYMHNALSFWRQYGLIFFVLFTVYYIYLFCNLCVYWLKNKNAQIDFVFYLSALFFIYLLIFHAYSYGYIWFVFVLMHLTVRQIGAESR